VAPLVALAMVFALMLQVRTYAAQDDSGPFHAHVRQLVDRIPIRIGDWEGTDGKIPAAAGKILKPNAQFCRHYRNKTTGRQVTMLLIHCRDSRDMTGHYPPVCYPAHGWTTLGKPQQTTMRLWGTEVPLAAYGFGRAEFDHYIRCTIYNFFVLPKGGLVTSMPQVASASADYRTRPYGAAQIQVIFDFDTPESEQTEALGELLAPFGPVIDSMYVKDGGPKP